MTLFVFIAAFVVGVAGMTVDGYHQYVLWVKGDKAKALKLHYIGLGQVVAAGFALAATRHWLWLAVIWVWSFASFFDGLSLRAGIRYERRQAEAAKSIDQAIKAIYDEMGAPPPRGGDTVSFRLADSDLAHYLNPEQLDDVLTGEVVHVFRSDPEVQVKVPDWATVHTVPIARLLYARTDHQ